MRHKLFALCAALGLAFTAAPAAATSMKDAAAATYKLYEVNAEGVLRPMCSMTYIGEGTTEKAGNQDFFLTAAHCVRDTKKTYAIVDTRLDDEFQPLSAETYYLDVVRAIPSEDVALLRTRYRLRNAPAPADIATPGSVQPQIGDPIMVIGYPLAWDLTLTTGNFTGRVDGILDVKAPLYRATAAVQGGSSGGGLWYERQPGDYVLIGTVVAKVNMSEFMNFFTTEQKIANVLRYWTPFSPERQ